MSCDWVRKNIPLYYYGELPSEEEERLEDHLDGCQPCRRESERYQALTAALDCRREELPAGLLAECRHDLLRAVYRHDAPARHTASVWSSFRDAFTVLFGSIRRYRQPIGAVALLALGYFSARLTTNPQAAPELTAAPSDVVYSTIRSVQPDAAGQVQIALDETRRRVVSGRVEDGNIRRLLLAAVREEDNPAVRVESVGLLREQPGSADVRRVLLNAILHDANAGVRLKALEALKPYTADSEVRKTLAQVLLSDENPGVRIQSIDMLVEHRDDSMVGVLQNLVQKDNNSYVRLKCERALREMNASIGTF